MEGDEWDVTGGSRGPSLCCWELTWAPREPPRGWLHLGFTLAGLSVPLSPLEGGSGGRVDQEGEGPGPAASLLGTCALSTLRLALPICPAGSLGRSTSSWAHTYLCCQPGVKRPSQTWCLSSRTSGW